MSDSRRRKLHGFSESNDRLWEVITPEGSFCVTDYNWEVTGYSPEFRQAYPEEIGYGQNAYYILGQLAERNGWAVSQVEDRQ